MGEGRSKKLNMSLTSEINVLEVAAIAFDKVFVFLETYRLPNTLFDQGLVPHLFGSGLNR